jgi:hypothetical protein
MPGVVVIAKIADVASKNQNIPLSPEEDAPLDIASCRQTPNGDRKRIVFSSLLNYKHFIQLSQQSFTEFF